MEKNDEQEIKKTSCEAELNELKDKFVRISADFENYRKRIEKEKNFWDEDAQAEVFKDLLIIVDDFDRAIITHKKITNQEMDPWLEGFILINKLLEKLLDKYNVKEIAKTENFDPNIHEAIIQIESKEHETGQIIEVLQKGYTFKGKILRHTKVSVAK